MCLCNVSPVDTWSYYGKENIIMSFYNTAHIATCQWYWISNKNHKIHPNFNFPCTVDIVHKALVTSSLI
uniref:Uncharacterized protein n=1 Tax=Amphimedon queenslandica TaxID=400682 RepID=A0A1X7VDD1_AMPQE